MDEFEAEVIGSDVSADNEVADTSGQSPASVPEDTESERRSPVWRFFSKCPGDNDGAICNGCQTRVSRKHGTTSNMRAHLESKHKTAFHELNALIMERKTVAGPSPAKRPRVSQQKSKDLYADLEESETLDKETQEMLNKELAFYMSTQNVPPSTVENGGLIRLLKVFRPGFKMPSRRDMVDNYIPKLHKETENSIRKYLMEAKDGIALTTDAWTSGHKEEFLTLTAHFIDDAYELVSIVLSCTPFSDAHDADHLALFISETLFKWNIDLDTIVGFNSDNASNIKKAIEQLRINQLGCFDHTTQLGINATLQDETVKPSVDKCKKVGTLFSSSNKARKALKRKFEETKTDGKMPPSSVTPTRWWSTTKLLPTITEQRTVIGDVINELPTGFKHVDNIPTATEVSRLKGLTATLKPFEILSNRMGSENKVTISAILPTVLECLDQLNSLKSNEAQSLENPEDEMKKLLLTNVCSYYRKYYYPVKADGTRPRTRLSKVQQRCEEAYQLLTKCTYLDPKFRDAVNEADKDLGRSLLLGEMLCALDKKKKASKSEVPSTSQDHPPANNRKKEEFGITFRRKRSLKKTEEQIIQDEFNRYEQIVDLPEELDVLQWWKANQSIFPNLHRMAKKYLSIPATSVCSERTFSTAGRVISLQRHRLSDEHSEQLIFLSCNKYFVPK